MPSKKGRDVFYATGFVVSKPLLKLDVIKNVRATVFILYPLCIYIYTKSCDTPGPP